ncbi:hypothetical protein C7Y66_23640 [Chroococcidiopsis sp. CCALA 051]|uniref:hypothetical protein n=1 Tax=Chroococcidiopsis sp. CCALA 051 TaxID=869949 RepID=UPI000D0DDB9E|nr:hypothetical protein [Chroococcidiopsis sp. CCALA 051]PSM46694.1 hypothetical protein C7Y66_23640 [Chroococcidiopsis sp. CCALA 051]
MRLGVRESGQGGTRGPHDRREWGLGGEGGQGRRILPTTNYPLPNHQFRIPNSEFSPLTFN